MMKSGRMDDGAFSFEGFPGKGFPEGLSYFSILQIKAPWNPIRKKVSLYLVYGLAK